MKLVATAILVDPAPGEPHGPIALYPGDVLRIRQHGRDVAIVTLHPEEKKK